VRSNILLRLTNFEILDKNIHVSFTAGRQHRGGIQKNRGHGASIVVRPDKVGVTRLVTPCPCFRIKQIPNGEVCKAGRYERGRRWITTNATDRVDPRIRAAVKSEIQSLEGTKKKEKEENAQHNAQHTFCSDCADPSALILHRRSPTKLCALRTSREKISPDVQGQSCIEVWRRICGNRTRRSGLYLQWR